MGFFKNLVNALSKKDTTIKKSVEQQKQTINTFVNKKSSYNVGLNSSTKTFASNLNNLAAKYRTVDEQLFADLTIMLINFDIGYNTSKSITESLKEDVKLHGISDVNLIKNLLVDKLFTSYINNTVIDTSLDYKDGRTNCFMIVGANGVGKTTTIAKLAYLYKQMNKKVIIVAGDTFRSGAVEQLNVWAKKIGVDIYEGPRPNMDPAAVIYDGVKKAVENKYDLVICDTAGRLQNKVNLMNELKKINNVIKKYISNYNYETLLVLDATTGQTGLSQAQAFNDACHLSGIILTKMDGTSKGGIIFAIKDFFNLPVKLIGYGEKLEDLDFFDLEKFVDNLSQDLVLKK